MNDFGFNQLFESHWWWWRGGGGGKQDQHDYALLFRKIVY